MCTAAAALAALFCKSLEAQLGRASASFCFGAEDSRFGVFRSHLVYQCVLIYHHCVFLKCSVAIQEE